MLPSNKQHGTLVFWNDEKGFGFLETEEGSSRVFLHISALPTGVRRPKEGDTLLFAIQTQTDGKLRAVKAAFPSAPSTAQLSVSFQRKRTPHWAVWGVLLFVLGLGIGVGYTLWNSKQPANTPVAALHSLTSTPPKQVASSQTRISTKQSKPSPSSKNTPKPQTSASPIAKHIEEPKPQKQEPETPIEEPSAEGNEVGGLNEVGSSGEVGEGLIKGNVSYRGIKYYHLPGTRDYDKTRINPRRGERYFRTEAEAQAAGWQKSPY